MGAKRIHVPRHRPRTGPRTSPIPDHTGARSAPAMSSPRLARGDGWPPTAAATLAPAEDPGLQVPLRHGFRLLYRLEELSRWDAPDAHPPRARPRVSPVDGL